jgi:rRNA maturation RNase YbeY
MAVLFNTLDARVPKFKRRAIKQWISATINKFGKKTGNITCIFCSDKEILHMNNRYMNHDYYTDIITFDYSENDIISGDLFISFDTVKSNSKEFDTKFKHELYRVIIHGILHLCGLNDESPEQRAVMRHNEDEALKSLLLELNP